MTTEKRVLIIAGPNGAGKTTFAREFLPKEADCPVFIDADLIAAGLSPFDPARAAIRAGRLMLEEIGRHAAAGISFAFETTLSGLTYAKRIPTWQAAGYRVKLFFLSLPSVEVAIARVAARVEQGGHAIPEEVIRRRYQAGWGNFNARYKHVVDAWVLYDNSGEIPRLLDEGEKS
jgi:predicted ABC-type ATPase